MSEETALVPRPTMELGQVVDPRGAADLVRWLGMRQRPDLIEPKEEEGGRAYMLRCWNKMQRSQRTEVVTAGIQEACWYRDTFEDGLQLVVFQAYNQGWVTFDSDGEFRGWVTDVLTAEGSSGTEATQLASTILNLTWLDANDFNLKNGLEDIFADRALYSRWRRVASKLRKTIEVAEQDTSADTVIKEIIKAVNDPDKKLRDLDKVGTQRPPLPPIVVTESPIKDDLGRVLFYGAMTNAQRSLLQQRMGEGISYELQGQEYDTDTHELSEYRKQMLYACPECGSVLDVAVCPMCSVACEEAPRWHYRVYHHDVGRWGHFAAIAGEPDLSSLPREGVPLTDQQLGLTYTRVWEKRDE